MKNPSYLDLDTEKQNVPLFIQSPENWLPTLPHLVFIVSCWVWALWQLKVMSESHVALSGWCWRQDSCSETKELPPWSRISKTWKEYFHHKIHTNSLSNNTPEHAYVSETHHLLTLALNLPVQVQKMKTSLMKHWYMSCSIYAIEMGSWKESENDLYFSWFLPKHVCSVGVLESFPEGKSQNLQCQSWIRVSLKRMKLVQCCMNGKCQIKGAIAVTYTEVLRKKNPLIHPSPPIP